MTIWSEDFSTYAANDWPHDYGVGTSINVSSGVLYAAVGGAGYGVANKTPDLKVLVSTGDVIEFAFDVTKVDDGGSDYVSTSQKSKIVIGLHDGSNFAGLLFYYYYNYREDQGGKYYGMIDGNYQGTRRDLVEPTSFRMEYVESTGNINIYADDHIQAEYLCYNTNVLAGASELHIEIKAYDRTGYNMQTRFDNFVLTAPAIVYYLYSGVMSGVFEEMEQISPFEGIVGRMKRYDPVYAPANEPDWVCDVPQNGDPFAYSNYSLQKYQPAQYDTPINMVCLPEFRDSMYLSFNVIYAFSYGMEFYIEAPDGNDFKIKFYYSSPDYIVELTRPDGTVATWSSTTNPGSYNRLEFIVKTDILTRVTTLTVGNIYNSISPLLFHTEPFPYEHFRVRLYVPPSTSLRYLNIGNHIYGCRWFPRTGEGPHFCCVDYEKMALDIEQKIDVMYNVFLEKIINSRDIYDPDTAKGIKLTNIDGMGTDMCAGSTCLVIDKYRRIYTYTLKKNIHVAESLPDIIVLARSVEGYYWELIHQGNVDDTENRLYSEQCMDHVTAAEPGFCDYDPAADPDTVMLQLVHNDKVNPLYLRAFKVPGMNRIRVEVTEPMTANNVKVNLILSV